MAAITRFITDRIYECEQLNKEIDDYFSAEIIRVGREIGFNIQNGMDTRDWTDPDDLRTLRDALKKHRESEVFSPDQDEVRKACDPYLEKLRRTDLSQIVAAYKRNFREGDQLFRPLLAEVLSIENLPSLMYVNRDEGDPNLRGQYLSRSNIVKIIEGNIPNRYYERMAILAHEMWHAYQHMKTGHQNGRNHLYKYNWDNYIKSNDNYAAYRSQLIESEAFYFGNTVKQIVSDTYA